MEFQSWKVNFKTEVCLKTVDLHHTMQWLKEVAQKYDRFIPVRQIASVIYEHFRATGTCGAVQGLSDLFNIRLQNDDVQGFRCTMGPSSIISKRNAFRCDPGRIVQAKIIGLCSASDCLGFVRSRNRSKQWTDKLFTIEDVCKATY